MQYILNDISINLAGYVRLENGVHDTNSTYSARVRPLVLQVTQPDTVCNKINDSSASNRKSH